MNAFKMLHQDEGLRLELYKCTQGYYTIGIGHMISKDKVQAMNWLNQRYGRQKITPQEARVLFDNDFNKAMKDSKSLVTLDEYRQLALANMIFQMGLSGVQKFKKMLAALRARDYNEAYKQALDSNWYKQTPNRAVRVAEVLRDGEKAYVQNYK